MAKTPYNFDGFNLRDQHGRVIAKVEGDTIRNARSIPVGRVSPAHVMDPAGKVVVTFDGTVISDRLGRKLGTIETVRDVIDGNGGITLVALWLFFAR